MTTRYTPYVTRRKRKEHQDNQRRKIAWVIVLFVIILGLLFITNSIWKHNNRPLFGFKGSSSIVESSPNEIPDFDGQDYVLLNNGVPTFNSWDLKNISGEFYSDLDSYGRCGVVYAMLDQSMMPTEEREGIGQIKPSGWQQAKYEDVIDSNPPYLYNRCHLIAYALTGQNANEKNLITGTRYMNVMSMLPWEEKVMRYLDTSDNHVLYRVTPYFKGSELVARGVEIEAYSVEDNGEGVCFHVFIYNIQPGVDIDYKTGESCVSE